MEKHCMASAGILHWDWDAWLGKKIGHGRCSRLHWDMDTQQGRHV